MPTSSKNEQPQHTPAHQLDQVLEKQKQKDEGDKNQQIHVNEETHQYVDRYLKILLWPAIIAGIFQISALYNNNQYKLILLANIALIIVVLMQTFRHHVNWQTAAIIGGLTCATSAFVVALYRVIFTFKVVFVFNLFTQTAIYGVIAAITTGFLFIIFQPIIIKISKERR